MLSYEGIFFENESADIISLFEKNKLERVNDIFHCTFKYHPANNEIFNEIVGKYFEVYLIGYGCDNENSGFEIKLPSELKKFYINYDEENPSILKIPHITTSLSKNGKASNTKNLKFIPIENPIKIVGRFGFWIKDENNEYISYEPYSKNGIK